MQENYCSWYNYELLSALRKRFLFSQLEDDKSLVDYELLFKEYVKRRCFLYSDDLGPQPQIETVSVTCKIDVDFAIITDDQIKELRLLFIECLQSLLSSYTFTLKHVKKGCTELVFRAPTWIIKYIPTLTPEQAQLLRENKFIEVTVGDRNILSLSKVCLINKSILCAYLGGSMKYCQMFDANLIGLYTYKSTPTNLCACTQKCHIYTLTQNIL